MNDGGIMDKNYEHRPRNDDDGGGGGGGSGDDNDSNNKINWLSVTHC